VPFNSTQRNLPHAFSIVASLAPGSLTVGTAGPEAIL